MHCSGSSCDASPSCWLLISKIKRKGRKIVLLFRGRLSGGSKGVQGTRAPWGSKFFQFHAGFGKFWQNRMLGPAPGGLEPPPREILDPPLVTKIVNLISNYKISLREVKDAPHLLFVNFSLSFYSSSTGLLIEPLHNAIVMVSVITVRLYVCLVAEG